MSSPDNPLKAAQEAMKKAARTADQQTTSTPVGENVASDTDAKTRSKPKTNDSDTDFDLFDLPVIGALFKSIAQIWTQGFGPIARFFGPLTRLLSKTYRWSYRTFATRRDHDGARALLPVRVMVVTIALAVMTVAVPWFLITQGIPFAARTAYDAGMLATMKEDTLFLGRPDIVDAPREIYQVTGCRDISGCDGGDNTIYYRLRPNIIMSIKYWTTRFEPYDPSEISAAMVSELNDCTIRYYGRRVKAFGWYPYIVNASCKPVKAG